MQLVICILTPKWLRNLLDFIAIQKPTCYPAGTIIPVHFEISFFLQSWKFHVHVRVFTSMMRIWKYFASWYGFSRPCTCYVNYVRITFKLRSITFLLCDIKNHRRQIMSRKAIGLQMLNSLLSWIWTRKVLPKVRQVCQNYKFTNYSSQVQQKRHICHTPFCQSNHAPAKSWVSPIKSARRSERVCVLNFLREKLQQKPKSSRAPENLTWKPEPPPKNGWFVYAFHF